MSYSEKKNVLLLITQLKNATERLGLEDITLRAILEEINRTLSIKVLPFWSSM